MRYFSLVFSTVCFLVANYGFSQDIFTRAENGEKLDENEIVKLADSIHKKYITLDSHNDSAMWFNNPKGDYGVQKGQVSFPLMKQGGLDGAFFAIYMEQGKLDQHSLDSTFNICVREISKFKEYVKKRKNEAEFARNAADVALIKAKGKRAIILTIENGYPIGKKLDNIDFFYNRGVRLITLSHNGNNCICDASMSKIGEFYGGLSDFGYKVVERMNNLGIIVDVSHASSSTLEDVLGCSKAPLVASHSGVWSIKNHKRNLKDSEIKAIAAKGGVIQVATGRFFLSDLPKAQVNVGSLCDHIEHVIKLVGIEHVGLGTDFDGGGGVVGLENVSKMKEITKELLRRGYKPSEIALFWGENILRVWREVEAVAKVK